MGSLLMKRSEGDWPRETRRYEAVCFLPRSGGFIAGKSGIPPALTDLYRNRRSFVFGMIVTIDSTKESRLSTAAGSEDPAKDHSPVSGDARSTVRLGAQPRWRIEIDGTPLA